MSSLPAWAVVVIALITALGGLSGGAAILKTVYEKRIHEATARKIDAEGDALEQGGMAARAESIAESAQKVIAFAETRMANQQREIDVYCKRVSEVEASYMTVMGEMIEAQKKMAEKDRMIETLTAERKVQDKTIGELKEQVADLTRQNQALAQTVSQLSCRVQGLERRD